MEQDQAFRQRIELFATRIASSARQHENILIVCHCEADGICAASIISHFIFRNNGHCEIRPISEPTTRSLEKIAQSHFDLVLFVDLGSNNSDSLTKYLGDKWFVIDHHMISEEMRSGTPSEKILNPWHFGFDGSKEISCSVLAFLLAERARSDLSPFLAIVGALGDGQDSGPKRTLIGLNAKIAEEAQSSTHQIETKVDLLFHGRDVRPIHEAVANSMTYYVPGLTGNKDACLASLRSAGLDLKSNARWRTIEDLSEEEKQQVLAAIAPHLSGTTLNIEDFSGTVYCSIAIDEYSLMHDARDFATLLSICGRMNKGGIALLLCLGDSPDLTNEVDAIFSSYRTELVRTVQTLISSADRFIDRQHYSIILGDGVLNEGMTGAVCQIISSLNRSKNKIVFLRTTTQDGDVKVSARLGRGAVADLGLMMQSIAHATSGIGGGHSTKGGSKFSIARQQEFQPAVEAQFQTLKTK
jgi:single-stranded-DNA-specific exonuclease